MCEGCGNATLFLDKTRAARNNTGCGCDGYHFHHRAGSLQCVSGKDPHGMTALELEARAAQEESDEADLEWALGLSSSG